MIKVLRIINRFNLGGPTYNAAYLTRYIGDNYRTLLVGGQQDKNEENSEYILKNLGIIPITIPEMHRSINPFADLIAYKKIKQIIEDFQPHIVHTHASKAGALGRKAAYNMHVPVIVHTFHGHVFDAYFSKFQSNFYINLERRLATKSDAIITLSENQKYDIIHKYKICSEDKSHIIPLGFDLTKFQEDYEYKRSFYRCKYQIKDDEVAIGIVGRLVPIKNHQLFVEAIKELYFKSSVNIRAFIIGDGETKSQIQSLLRKYHIPYSEGTENPKTVVFTSWEKDVDYANAGMDIIALTSLNEGTPVSLIEAQSANKPIITTNVGGIKNIVIENETALIADVNNTEEFISKLRLLVENESLRANMSKKGHDFAINRFHYTRLISDVSNLYENLLSKK